jgi:hypothetical protein
MSWGWDCGFYPLSHQGVREDGTAADFEAARAEFEAAWREYLPKCTEADFAEYRRKEAWTAWKYAMRDAGCRMPTQSTSGVARCFCGATIEYKGYRSARLLRAHEGPAARLRYVTDRPFAAPEAAARRECPNDFTLVAAPSKKRPSSGVS